MVASSIHQRPKPVEIEDRDEAQATLESLLEKDSDVTWVQFRYRIIRGGAGLVRATEKAEELGVARDLTELTLEEVGSGGIDELRSQLPPHEIAYVVYNNSKGSKREDQLAEKGKVQEGTRWKKWLNLLKEEKHRFVREHLYDWAWLVEHNAQAAECIRLKKLLAALNFYVPPEVPMHDPIKFIEFMCQLSPSLNKVYKKALEELFSNDAAHTVLQATAAVADHLDNLEAERLARIAEEERLKLEKIKQRKIQAKKRAAITASQKAAAEKHAQKMGGRRRVNVPDPKAGGKDLKLDEMWGALQETGSLVSLNSARMSEAEKSEMTHSDDFDDDSLWDAESSWDGKSMISMASKMESPLISRSRSRAAAGESPMKAESVKKGESLRLTPYNNDIAEESASAVSKSLHAGGRGSDISRGSGKEPDPLDELAGMEWDDEEYENKEEDDDTYFQWTIEEEARRLAIVMEQSAQKMQAVARGYRDRQRVRQIQREMFAYWDDKHRRAREYNVIVVLVWCPESTSMAMRELPLYHMRDVIDLLNDSSAEMNEQALGKFSVKFTNLNEDLVHAT